MQEHEALRLLENRHETKTFKELRQMVIDIDIDQNRELSFLEWACAIFNKSWAQLHTPCVGTYGTALSFSASSSSSSSCLSFSLVVLLPLFFLDMVALILLLLSRCYYRSRRSCSCRSSVKCGVPRSCREGSQGGPRSSSGGRKTPRDSQGSR